MSTAQIVRLSDEHAERAAKEKRVPYIPFDAAEVDRWETLPISWLGSHRPKGWELEKYYTCDKSGHGYEHEIALTVRGTKEMVKREMAKPGTRGFAVIEEGPFQIVIGVFRRIDGEEQATNAV